MSHHAADKIESLVRDAVPQVEDVRTRDGAPGELIATVVIPTIDWDVRAQIIDVIDRVAQSYAREVTIIPEVIDAETSSFATA